MGRDDLANWEGKAVYDGTVRPKKLLGTWRNCRINNVGDVTCDFIPLDADADTPIYVQALGEI